MKSILTATTTAGERLGVEFSFADGSRELIPFSVIEQLLETRRIVQEQAEEARCNHYGRVSEKVMRVIQHYKGTAEDAMAGAESIRNDMLVYLRSTVFVIEGVANDHISHAEAKARLRGVICVLEQHIASLRTEQFKFHGSMWRRDRDLFQWREGEKRLRKELDSAKAEISRLIKASATVNHEGEDDVVEF